MFHKLVASADAVLDNLRGDLPNTLGACCPARKDINPRNVCAHFSAYGREGPRTTAWPGDDCLMQAEAGHMSLTGEQDGPPTRYGLPIVDIMSGLVAAFGRLAGVVSARASGLGLDMHTSLVDVALHNLNDPGTGYLNGGTGTGRTARSARPGWCPAVGRRQGCRYLDTGTLARRRSALRNAPRNTLRTTLRTTLRNL